MIHALNSAEQSEEIHVCSELAAAETEILYSNFLQSLRAQAEEPEELSCL